MGNYYTFISRHEDNNVVTAKFKSNIHAQGAWNEAEQHMAPATGIICHELENYHADECHAKNMRIGRVSLDIFGMIHFGEFDIVTKIIRHGRTIELIESTMIAKGQTCIVARAWRMVMSDTSKVCGIEDKPIASPHQLPEYHGMAHWGGGFIQSLEFKADKKNRAGKGIMWVYSPHDMVEGCDTSDFVRLMGLVDTANGTVPRIVQAEHLVDDSNKKDSNKKIAWLFPNLDLQIHLYRKPQGKWLGLETVQQIGNDGIGLSSSILHDECGAFGRSEQIMTVRALKNNL